jgi:hypothetical protein
MPGLLPPALGQNQVSTKAGQVHRDSARLNRRSVRAQAVSIAGLSRAYETSAARRPVLAVFLSDL